jgi:hypothetical protein
MVIPPPNVTGKLHLGHALTNSVEDAITRYWCSSSFCSSKRKNEDIFPLANLFVFFFYFKLYLLEPEVVFRKPKNNRTNKLMTGLG